MYVADTGGPAHSVTSLLAMETRETGRLPLNSFDARFLLGGSRQGSQKGQAQQAQPPGSRITLNEAEQALSRLRETGRDQQGRVRTESGAPGRSRGLLALFR